jgi:hypothetical protein
MSKRSADRELNQNNFDDEDDQEVPDANQTWKAASQDKLKQRV